VIQEHAHSDSEGPPDLSKLPYISKKRSRTRNTESILTGYRSDIENIAFRVWTA
jgi:hypothetical protein